MIELRWLIRQGWDGPENILQYRQKVDTAIRAGGNWTATEIMNTARTQWSEWTDVPEVKDV